MKKLTKFEIEKKLENFPDWDYYEMHYIQSLNLIVLKTA